MEQLTLFSPCEFVDLAHGMSAISTRRKREKQSQEKSPKLFFLRPPFKNHNQSRIQVIAHEATKRILVRELIVCDTTQ